MSNALDGLFGGVNRVLLEGVEQPFHPTINLLGGWTVTEGDDGAGNPTLELTPPDGGGGPGATTLLASFTQPAVNSNVVANVADTGGLAVGMALFVAAGGYYQVVSIGDATHVTLKNLGYTGNAAPAASVPLTGLVVAGGFIGPTGASGAAGAAGPAGPPATLYDSAAAPLTSSTDLYSSGGINWRRINGKNQPARRKWENILDYGARSSTAGIGCTAMTAGAFVATISGASDFVNGDYVSLLGAGAAHNMITPATPSVTIVGTPGTTQREYAIAWLTADYGWSIASTVVSIANAPDVLTNPISQSGHGIDGDGSYIRIVPKYLDAKASETTNVALSGLAASDGQTFTDGQIVMLLGQTAPAENGPWAKHAGAWTRPTGFAVSGDLAQGMFVRVTTGTLRKRTLWQLTTAPAYTLGTTALTFTQLNAKTAVVWHRAGGTGNWEVAGGFLVNSYLFGLDIAFCDYGDRPTGVTQFTIPVVTPPSVAVANMLRTKIVSGAGTTSLTLADAAVTTVTTPSKRLMHDNTIPFNNCLAAAVARGAKIEIPEGDFQIWSDLKVESPRVHIEGYGLDVTNLNFGAGYGFTVGDGAPHFFMEDLSITMINRTLPGTDMMSVQVNSGGPVDECFHGAGLVIRSGETIISRVRLANIYGSGVLVRGGASEGTNANRTNLYDVEATTCYGNGIQYGGGDGNAGLVQRCNVNVCSGEGFSDCSFLGNTWSACHVSGCQQRSYNVRDETAKAYIVGCYSESGSNNPARISAAAILIGGTHGAGIDPASTGIVILNSGVTSPVNVQSGVRAVTWGANVQRRPYSDYVVPTVNNGFVYVVSNTVGDRRNGASEPVWPLTIGDTVVNGNVTFKNTGMKPPRDLQLGSLSNQNLLLSFSELGAPAFLNHSLIWAPSTNYAAWSFVGSQHGDAFRLNGLGATSPPRGVGMMHFPTFFLTGNSSSHYRRFGFSWGTPDDPGVHSAGDTYIDQNTSRVYRAAADFCLGATTWTANTLYKVGDCVTPVTPDGFAYYNAKATRNSNNSMSHATTEPTWGAGTIVDNECEWHRHGTATAQWAVDVTMFEGTHLTDADATISVGASSVNGNKRTLHVALTANRTIRIASTGAVKGEVLEIVRLGLGAFTLTVLDDVSGATLYTFPVSQARGADFKWDGTNWQGPATGGGSHARIN